MPLPNRVTATLTQVKNCKIKVDVLYGTADKLLDPKSSTKKTLKKLKDVRKSLEEVRGRLPCLQESVLAAEITLAEFATTEYEYNDITREDGLNKYLDVTDQLDDLIEDHTCVDEKPEAKSGPSKDVVEAAFNSEISSITKGIKDLEDKVDKIPHKSMIAVQIEAHHRIVSKLEE